jgi:hypothetical protein
MIYLGFGFVVVSRDDHTVGPLANVLQSAVAGSNYEGLAPHQLLVTLRIQRYYY